MQFQDIFATFLDLADKTDELYERWLTVNSNLNTTLNQSRYLLKRTSLSHQLINLEQKPFPFKKRCWLTIFSMPINFALVCKLFKGGLILAISETQSKKWTLIRDKHELTFHAASETGFYRTASPLDFVVHHFRTLKWGSYKYLNVITPKRIH